MSVPCVREVTLRRRPRRARPGGARLVAVAAILACLGAAACTNPVVDRRIEELGGENPAVPAGEHHRPGQPCVLCHSVYEGASPQMSIGGTVFIDTDRLMPAEGVEVVLTDTRAVTRTVRTNCTGNFWITTEDWQPQFPLAAEIRYPSYQANGEPILDVDGEPVLRVKVMGSYVSRDGSCAGCHTLRGPQLDSTLWVYCNAPGEVNPIPDMREDCPGEPP